MNRISRIISVLLLCIGAFLLLEKPVLADSPIFWGMFGSMAPVFIGVLSKGVAFIGVIIIEALVIWRVFHLSVLRSLLISLWLNVVSSIAGLIVAMPMAVPFPCGLLLPVIFFGSLIAVRYRKLFPVWFTSIAYLLIVVGFIGVGFNMSVSSVQPPIDVFIGLMLPLIFGFGITLVAEGWGADRYFKKAINCKGILWMNICSYVFLAVMVVFIGPNYYSGSQGLNRSAGSVVSDVDGPKRAIEIFHVRRASNLELLGFVKESAPPAGYKAYSEIRLIERLLSLSYWYNIDPDATIEIIDDTLQIPMLDQEARDKLVWSKDYLSISKPVWQAIRDGDQGKLDAKYPEWIEWFRNNPYPVRLLSYESSEPGITVQVALRHLESNLVHPDPKFADENEGEQ